MIEAFGAYIENIVGLMMITALAEMIMPKGNFKNYIRLISGLIIVAAITEPAVELIYGKGFDIYGGSGYIFEADEKQRAIVNGIYMEEVEKQCSDIAGKMDIDIARIKYDSKNNMIDSIEIYIEEPHTCIDVLPYGKEQVICGECEKLVTDFEGAVKTATGVENIEINIL